MKHAHADEHAIEMYEPSPERYEGLYAVLEAAHDRAAKGKGRERHAQERPFEEQPILNITEMVGPGGLAFQIMKKAQESLRLTPADAQKELLDIIVYAAAWHIYLNSK